ncbi:MAG TPA: alpha/beta hydrolase [Pyrinomonadaceae bacterium]|jgi:pimeloyl-ACP methyl ester carboxylesterase|nr:alpha/beta hydrolase [Pyrinomonadaceae bacterium]
MRKTEAICATQQGFGCGREEDRFLARTEGTQAGFAELSGARFYYEVAGEGHPLVLVHAGIADLRMWDEQFDAFAAHYRVIRYDRRGFGRTTSRSEPFSHHQDLQSVMCFFGLEGSYLLGCSQGGKTILDFALEYPSMAKALVLVASAVGGFAFSGAAARQQSELEEAELRGDVARVNELELQIWVDGPHRTPSEVDTGLRERVREMNLIALNAEIDAGQEQPLEPPAVDRLEEIGVPTLIVSGELDTPKTLAAADLLAEKIPASRSVVINGTAHLPNMERPEEFNQYVLGFLKSLG